jgi:hypothetical protein
LSADHIVNATSVSVVDMREDAPVTVEVSIPSASVLEFVIRVTFLCTVTKPQEVVQAGVMSMTDQLRQYLVQHQPLFSLGEEYQLTQINTVQRNARAEVASYVSIRPPRFRGMNVKLGNVEILTPETLVKSFSIARQSERGRERPAEEPTVPAPNQKGHYMNIKAVDDRVNREIIQELSSVEQNHVSPYGHVFISYVHEDSSRIEPVQQALADAGLQVWRDKSNLWPGQDWRVEIRRAIAEGAFVFLACFSRNSTSRKKSYQNEELALAIEQLRLRPPSEPWFIPARLDLCEIPDLEIGGSRSLSSIQYVDLFGDPGGIANLVEAIKRILDRVQRNSESH